MKLQEFVSETLKEIIAGIVNAQAYAAEQSAGINPPSRHIGEGKQSIHIDDNTRQALQNVEFDVAVTSTEGSETKGSAGILVAAIGLGAQGRMDISSSTISRIKFSVPVLLPIQPGKK